MKNSSTLLTNLRNGNKLSFQDQLLLAVELSIPAMLAQLSTIIMHYIDAAMVGSIGAEASAAIGLVSTTTWIFFGISGALTTGFSVIVAQQIGANQFQNARDTLRKSLTFVLFFAIILSIIGISISSYLPKWLGGNSDLFADASAYFLVFSLRIPIMQMRYHFSSMLRSSGNMKSPGFYNVFMCILDIIFNYFLIFKSHNIHLFDTDICIPGADLGVMGAAIGTVLAEICVTIPLAYTLLVKSPELKLSLDANVKSKNYLPNLSLIRDSLKISVPIGIEHVTFCGAQVVTTIIVAPLGTIAIAANAFGIIVESLCYMPGYGIADAATTLVGQSIGAKRFKLCKYLSYMTLFLGITVMSFMAVLMFIFAPNIMSIMTPDQDVLNTTVTLLRIEAFAEPMYAASIIAYGIFVGSGRTFIPSCMNLFSIWCVRITLAFILTPIYGVQGVWLAMCIELCFRGIIFLIHLAKGQWLKSITVKKSLN